MLSANGDSFRVKNYDFHTFIALILKSLLHQQIFPFIDKQSLNYLNHFLYYLKFILLKTLCLSHFQLFFKIIQKIFLSHFKVK